MVEKKTYLLAMGKSWNYPDYIHIISGDKNWNCTLY